MGQIEGRGPAPRAGVRRSGSRDGPHTLSAWRGSQGPSAARSNRPTRLRNSASATQASGRASGAPGTRGCRARTRHAGSGRGRCRTGPGRGTASGAVRRPDHRQDQLPGRDHLAVHLHVPRGCPGHPLERRAEAQHLLDRRRQQVRGRPQVVELVRVAEEAQDGVVDQVGGRLLAADQQELHEPQDFIRRQPRAVHSAENRSITAHPLRQRR